MSEQFNLLIMRKLQILKALLDFFFVISIIAIIAMVVFIPIMFFSTEPIDIPIKINGERILVVDLITKSILTLGIVSYCFFVYGIYLLRKVLNMFAKRIIFEETVILLLDKIGKSFLIASIFTSVPLFVYNITHKTDHADVEFGGGFSSFLFTASLGLFFMVLSTVFKIAKNMKEENELTI